MGHEDQRDVHTISVTEHSDLSGRQPLTLRQQMLIEERQYPLLVGLAMSTPALVVSGVGKQPQRILGARRLPQLAHLIGRKAIVLEAMDEQHRAIAKSADCR